MPAVVLLIIVLLVVFLVVKSVHDSRGRADDTDGSEPDTGATRSGLAQRRASQKPSSPAANIDRQALSAHVTKLREAVAHGLISADEAAASVVRHTDGELSEESARQLLDSDDEAA